jgi:ribosomal protein S18 acetylase RimI-like enzyme
MGIGDALAQRVIAQARVEGAPALFLTVWEDNLPALGLYRKLGFERASLPALDEELGADELRYGRRRQLLRRPL